MSDIKRVTVLQNEESNDNKLQPNEVTNHSVNKPINSMSNSHSLSTPNDNYCEDKTINSNEPQKSSVKKRKISIFSVIQLMIPISITMFLVIMYVKFVCENDCHKKRGHPLLPLDDTRIESKTQKTINALVNALTIIIPIVVMTFVLFFLFYFRCDKLILGYLMFAFLFISFFISSIIFREILIRFNIPFDSITGFLLVFNYSALAMISIFWRGPLILQQTFLIHTSALMSLNIMTVLSEWTTWALLIVLVFWDLIAVLCPFGPLRLLVSTYVKRKNENKDYNLPPGLLYSTMVSMFIILDSVPNDKIERNSNENSSENVDKEITKDGPKLGLGDFVFYSLLMGMASIYGDFNLILGCYTGILVGLMLTLLLLVVYERPLPALPISITLAIIIFFVSQFAVTPFLNKLSNQLIYT